MTICCKLGECNKERLMRHVAVVVLYCGSNRKVRPFVVLRECLIVLACGSRRNGETR